MADLNEAREELQAIADRSETSDDIYREVARLKPEEKMRMVFATFADQFFEDINEASLLTIDICEAYGILNCTESMSFKRCRALGILRAVAKTYEQSSEQMARQELQAQDENTQYATGLSDAINDLARELDLIIEHLITLDARYGAVLLGRKQGVNFINDEGDFVPMSEEVIAANEQHKKDYARDFDEWQTKERKLVELVASGTIDPPPLKEGQDSRQLVLPTWK